MKYAIAAIPTEYRGRMYRSRLEARWAAFFDRLGWTHEYEPFDLGKWSPDFAITAPFNALVEVKPITEPDYETMERMIDACPKGLLILTGVAPVPHDDFVQLGWWPSSYQPLFAIWLRDRVKPRIYCDALVVVSDGSAWISGTQGVMWEKDEPKKLSAHYWCYPAHTMELWNDACNAVQWEPGQ